jgi:16S rRNA processing protein RimM
VDRERSTPGSNETLVVAELGPAHGIRGEITARLCGVEPAWLQGRSGVILRERDGKERGVVVERIRPKKDHWILEIDLLKDRSRAEATRGAVLLVPRVELPPPDGGEWYVADLVGLAVVTEAGESLGVLEEVLKLPANDVFVVRGGRGEILLPVTDEVVRAVDLGEGRVVVRLLPGLVDEEGGRGSGS